MSASRANQIARSGLVKLKASLVDTKVDLLLRVQDALCADELKKRKGITNVGR